MAEVFISYSRRDQEFAFQLVEALGLHDYTSWLDKKDVFPGGTFWEDIKSGIEKAGAFIFILSPDSLVSEMCGEELRYAQECGKKLILLHYRRVTRDRTPQVLREL